MFQWERSLVSGNRPASKSHRCHMEYVVILEQGETPFGVYGPELPGWVAVGETREEAMHLIREAIELHIESLRENGEPVPSPHSFFEKVDVLLWGAEAGARLRST